MDRSPVSHATTILMVRKGGRVVIGGDGQVSLGQTIVKGNARKVRRLAKGAVIGGFAGATADAFTLFERLESKLEQYPGPVTILVLGAFVLLLSAGWTPLRAFVLARMSPVWQQRLPPHAPR